MVPGVLLERGKLSKTPFERKKNPKGKLVIVNPSRKIGRGFFNKGGAFIFGVLRIREKA